MYFSSFMLYVIVFLSLKRNTKHTHTHTAINIGLGNTSYFQKVLKRLKTLDAEPHNIVNGLILI